MNGAVKDKMFENIKRSSKMSSAYGLMDAEYKKCVGGNVVNGGNEVAKFENVKAEIADALKELDAMMKAHGVTHSEEHAAYKKDVWHI